MILPNLIIAGAPKCGTTALFDYLSAHPEVCPSSIKETYYFIDEGYPLFNTDNNFKKNGLSGYQEYFSQCAAGLFPVVMEATPDYLYQKTPLEVFSGFENKPQVIIVLRKPSARVYSMFQFARNNMATIKKSILFSDFIDMVKKGDDYLDTRVLLKNSIEQSRYENFLPGWINAVGKSNVKIYLFENMVSNTQKFMFQVADFLDIDSTYYENYVFTRSNETYQVSNQWLHKQMKKYNSIVDNRIIRQGMKRIYYGLNLRFTKSSSTEEIEETLSILDDMFVSTYASLESNYGIDLSVWK